MFLPLFFKSLSFETYGLTPKAILNNFQSEEPVTWRDMAVIPLNKLLVGEKLEIDIEGSGFSSDNVIIITSSGKISLRGAPDAPGGNTLFFSVTENEERVLLVVMNDLGHFNGLGRIDSVAIKRLSETDRFSFEDDD